LGLKELLELVGNLLGDGGVGAKKGGANKKGVPNQKASLPARQVKGTTEKEV
jgi:hypothetical protein